MEAIKIIFLSIIFLFSINSYASEVIDLGSLQVEGEVRKPGVSFISSKKVPLKIFKKVAEGVLVDFEKKLLSEKIGTRNKLK